MICMLSVCVISIPDLPRKGRNAMFINLLCLWPFSTKMEWVVISKDVLHAMQALPLNVLKCLLLAFCLDPNAERDKTSVALANTCKTVHGAVQNSRAGFAGELWALTRLVQAKIGTDSQFTGTPIPVARQKVAKMVRLMHWKLPGTLA